MHLHRRWRAWQNPAPPLAAPMPLERIVALHLHGMVARTMGPWRSTWSSVDLIILQTSPTKQCTANLANSDQSSPAITPNPGTITWPLRRALGGTYLYCTGLGPVEGEPLSHLLFVDRPIAIPPSAPSTSLELAPVELMELPKPHLR